jgi:hypothetical protein
MPSLLQNDYFMVGLILFSAALVNKHERASALVYAAFCFVALLACYKIPAPDILLQISNDPDIADKGWQLLLCSASSLMVVALIYQIRKCINGILPKILIYICYAEILLHITGYALLLNGVSWMAYNWAVLTVQLVVILLFAARGGYGRDFLRTRLFRDSAHSH